MIQKNQKSLPSPMLKTLYQTDNKAVKQQNSSGILLGFDTYWNPEHLPNAHTVIIGAVWLRQNPNPKSDRLRTPEAIPTLKTSCRRLPQAANTHNLS